MKQKNRQTRAQSCYFTALLFSGYEFISSPSLHLYVLDYQLCATPLRLAFYHTAQTLQSTRAEGTESKILPLGHNSWESKSKTIFPLELHIVEIEEEKRKPITHAKDTPPLNPVKFLHHGVIAFKSALPANEQ